MICPGCRDQNHGRCEDYLHPQRLSRGCDCLHRDWLREQAALAAEVEAMAVPAMKRRSKKTPLSLPLVPDEA